MKKLLAVAAATLMLSGCTAVTKANLGNRPVAAGGNFILVGDIDVPYDSMGPVQATRRGVILFGNLDPVGFDLQACLDETLMPEVRRMGADGIINLKFEQTQLTGAGRVLGAIFFFIPFPAEVTIRGEAVLLKDR